MAQFRTLLIANRGEIARRIMRTAHEMGIRTIAVFADVDRLEPHVREADVAVPISGPTPSAAYLDRDEIMKAAEWQGVDAVHPGYGFLSESALFARTVVNAGLTWIGPPPEAITAMGDKIAAKSTAFDAHIPVLSSAELHGQDEHAWIDQAGSVGYPLLIKAAAGGGGKGMRVVYSEDALAVAVESAQREALSSFGNNTVFAEFYLERPRHVEIQVFADTHGNVVQLGERECSIQRRHQKIIEESPSPVLDPDLRERMGNAAVELARTIGYVGAGTVEFLLDDQTGKFYFLEMNTRLQVEHPVTELVTGLDLVRLQFEVAMGEPLPFSQDDISLTGHSLEARIYAEDPAEGWLPSTGSLHRWQCATAGVRCDSGVETGSIVTTHFDPMLAKIITHARTRDEARARLVRALRELQIHGVTTNRDYLVEVLTEDDFHAGETRTDFVDRHPPTRAASDDPTAYERERQRFNAIIGPHLAAAALVGPSLRVTGNEPAERWPFVPTGWRNVSSAGTEVRPGGTGWRPVQTQSGFAPQAIAFERAGQQWDVTYTRVSRDHPFARRRREQERAAPGEIPSDLFNVTIRGPRGNNSTTLVEVIRLAHDVALVHFGRRGHRCTIQVVGDAYYVNSPLGQSNFVERPRFRDHSLVEAAGGPTAPVPGRIVTIEVAVGDMIVVGQALLVLEAMKVEHRITAASAGVVVEILVGVGDNVDAHQLLVRLEESTD